MDLKINILYDSDSLSCNSLICYNSADKFNISFSNTEITSSLLFYNKYKNNTLSQLFDDLFFIKYDYLKRFMDFSLEIFLNKKFLLNKKTDKNQSFIITCFFNKIKNHLKNKTELDMESNKFKEEFEKKFDTDLEKIIQTKINDKIKLEYTEFYLEFSQIQKKFNILDEKINKIKKEITEINKEKDEITEKYKKAGFGNEIIKQKYLEINKIYKDKTDLYNKTSIDLNDIKKDYDKTLDKYNEIVQKIIGKDYIPYSKLENKYLELQQKYGKIFIETKKELDENNKETYSFTINFKYILPEMIINKINTPNNMDENLRKIKNSVSDLIYCGKHGFIDLEGFQSIDELNEIKAVKIDDYIDLIEDESNYVSLSEKTIDYSDKEESLLDTALLTISDRKSDLVFIITQNGNLKYEIETSSQSKTSNIFYASNNKEFFEKLITYLNENYFYICELPKLNENMPEWFKKRYSN